MGRREENQRWWGDRNIERSASHTTHIHALTTQAEASLYNRKDRGWGERELRGRGKERQIPFRCLYIDTSLFLKITIFLCKIFK